ncbi:GNAT family N-acetyltransferase [Streptomyces sp. NPDC017991]|uniref:GNAT family N-acetyltransferase n=1 Tax=Streptomyces sp. NPDC017991 TaxID=3365026 RepID=UPI0037961B76
MAVAEHGLLGSPHRAAVLGGALVHPAHRSQGFARTAISVTVEHARAAGAETMTLLCRPDLVTLHTELGWSRLSVPVAFQQPDGARTLPLTAGCVEGQWMARFPKRARQCQTFFRS